VDRTSKRLWLGITALCVLLSACSHLTNTRSSSGASAIVLKSEVWTNPPMHLFIAEVDLKNPHVQVRVAGGGPDPDGPGPWQTILTPPTQIATREHFDLVVNGDFFASRRIKNPDGSTNTLPDPEHWGSAQGAAVTDGVVWSTAKTNRPCLILHKDGSFAIKPIKQPSPDDWEVVGGNVILLRDGAIVHHADTNRHPRTCVGLTADRSKMILLVVDGRKPGVSIGMRYDDLAATLLRLGCNDALNLDGGGSTIMAVRDKETGEYRTLNVPSDGHERPVADVLGITVTSSQR